MVYNISEAYTAEDVSSIAIDGVGTGIVGLISFVSLIVLVVLYAWFKKKMR